MTDLQKETVVAKCKVLDVPTLVPKCPRKSVELKTTVVSKDVVVFTVASSTTSSKLNATSNLAPSSAVTFL